MLLDQSFRRVSQPLLLLSSIGSTDEIGVVVVVVGGGGRVQSVRDHERRRRRIESGGGGAVGKFEITSRKSRELCQEGEEKMILAL